MANRIKEPHAQSPRKLESGRWQGRVTYYDANTGKRRQASETFATEREAKKWGREQEMEFRSRPNRNPHTEETLAEYLDRWLEDVVKMRRRDSTFRRYRHSARDVQRILGSMQLTRVTAPHIQAMYNQLLGEGKAPGTVKHVHVVLHAALKVAVKWDLIPRNPTEGTEPPAPQPRELTVPTPEQARNFLKAIQQERFYALWIFFALTGVRRGEALAIQWGDIDWGARTVTIQRTMSGDASQRRIHPPKTRAGRRSIDLSDYLVAVLQEHRHRQNLEREDAGTRWQEGQWVFTTRNGTWLSPAHVYERFKVLAKRHELPEGVRIHDLRHAMATYWLANGVPVKIVSERLGHANVGITLQLYGHVLPGMQARAAEQMDQWLLGSE